MAVHTRTACACPHTFAQPKYTTSGDSSRFQARLLLAPCEQVCTQLCMQHGGLQRQQALLVGSFASGYITGRSQHTPAPEALLHSSVWRDHTESTADPHHRPHPQSHTGRPLLPSRLPRRHLRMGQSAGRSGWVQRTHFHRQTTPAVWARIHPSDPRGRRADYIVGVGSAAAPRIRILTRVQHSESRR